MNDSKLVLYDQMRSAIAKCAEVDEVAGIKNQAARLEAYARVRDDAESQRQFAEIRLRACVRIGEISRDLEKGAGRPTKEILPTDGKNLTKAETLAEAGISTSTANRYEELAGGPEEQAQKIAAQAAETYFARQREKQEPSTMNGLKEAITGAVNAALGPPPIKPKKGPPQLDAQDQANMNWNAWMMNLERLEPELAADGETEEFAQEELNQSERAVALIRRYQARMEANFNVTTKT